MSLSWSCQDGSSFVVKLQNWVSLSRNEPVMGQAKGIILMPNNRKSAFDGHSSDHPWYPPSLSILSWMLHKLTVNHVRCSPVKLHTLDLLIPPNCKIKHKQINSYHEMFG